MIQAAGNRFLSKTCCLGAVVVIYQNWTLRFMLDFLAIHREGEQKKKR